MIQVTIICESNSSHVQKIEVKGMTLEEAEDFASILDGTSKFYKYPPRDFPSGSSLSHRCQECGSFFRAIAVAANGND